jgi:hypothetical protein
MTFYPSEIYVYLNHNLFHQHWLATNLNEHKFRNGVLEYGVWKKNFKISQSVFLVSRRYFEILIRKNVEQSIVA